MARIPHRRMFAVSTTGSFSTHGSLGGALLTNGPICALNGDQPLPSVSFALPALKRFLESFFQTRTGSLEETLAGDRHVAAEGPRRL